MSESVFYEFSAVLERGSEAVNSGYFLRVPEAVSQGLGKKGQVPVRVYFGEQSFRLSLAPYGGVYWLGLRNEVREALGCKPGDELRPRLCFDAEPRPVELPPELEDALRTEPEILLAWKALAPSHQKEYARWVAEAKKPETRLLRATKALERLGQGKKDPRS